MEEKIKPKFNFWLLLLLLRNWKVRAGSICVERTHPLNQERQKFVWAIRNPGSIEKGGRKTGLNISVALPLLMLTAPQCTEVCKLPD